MGSLPNCTDQFWWGSLVTYSFQRTEPINLRFSAALYLPLSLKDTLCIRAYTMFVHILTMYRGCFFTERLTFYKKTKRAHFIRHRFAHLWDITFY